MFGDALLQTIVWLGPWNCLCAIYAGFIGIGAGVAWRQSTAYNRRQRRQAEDRKRFCRECRWAAPDPDPKHSADWRFARCLHSSARIHPERFLVTGEDRWEEMNLCSSARSDLYNSNCGPGGRFWEQGPQLITSISEIRLTSASSTSATGGTRNE